MTKILEYLQSFVTIALILAGIGGVAYHMFKQGGWVSVAFSKFVDVQTANPVVAVPFTIAVVVIGKLWFDRKRAQGHTSRLPDVLIYVVMAAGVYFLWELSRELFFT